MTEKSLEKAVFEAAVSARRLLEENNLDKVAQDATYKFLTSAAEYTAAVQSNYAPYVARMLFTYKERLAKKSGQRSLFEGCGTQSWED